MSYELILHPKAPAPVCPKSLRRALLAAGLQAHPDSGQAGMLVGHFAFYELRADAATQAGISVSVRIPYGLKFIDVNIELLNLERLAGAIDADLIDGGQALVLAGPGALGSILSFHNRYERASEAAPQTQDFKSQDARRKMKNLP